MLKKTIGFACAAVCLGAFGAPTFGVVDGKYMVDVPEGEDYTLTADDVATMMDEDNVAYPLAKKGGGTLIVGTVMAEYTNDIYILDGQYKAIAATSFGTTNGITYVDGGTLWSTVGAGTGWTAQGGNPSYGGEKFHLKGTGYNNLGAIHQTNNGCSNFAGRGGVTLDGDIRVTGTQTLEFRYGTVNCNSNTITVAMNANVLFRFVALSIWNPGSIEVESGLFGFESGTGTGSSEYSVTIEPGAKLYLNNCQNLQNRTLWLKDGAGVQISTGGTHTPGSMASPMNQWNGPVTVDGNVPVDFFGIGRTFNLSSLVSGDGGFTGYGGGYIQIANPDNSFAGGVSVTGKVGAVAGVVTGGVSAVKTESTGNTYMAPFAPIPTNGEPVRIANAQLGVFNARIADLPDVIADGRTCVTGSPLLVKGTLKSLTKTGSDALTISGPFHVAGATDVQSGTLRFGTRVPDVPTGLNWYYSWGTAGSRSQTIPSNVPFRGVEPGGASFAYKYWPSTTGENNAPTHLQAHYYTGYVRIPGEEGESVTCNFVSAIARYTLLAIDGTVVVNVNDNQDVLHNVTIGYSRLYVGPPVTFTAGWKRFFLYMGNAWNATAGPKINNSALGWPYDFGIGVDWQARCVTNSANYVKFLDPGDGSFLRPTLAGKAEVDPASYGLPTFGGAVTFGPGTVFDVGDVAPYTPVTVPALTGVPTVMNGEVHVTNTTWTLRAADVAAGQPLTVAAGAKVKFAAGTTIVVQDEDDIPHQLVKEYPVLRVEEGGTIENTPAYARPRGSKWFAEWTENNTQLKLVYHNDFHIFVR